MSDVMNAMDGVYAKWEKRATLNGRTLMPDNSADDVLERGKKAWSTKFRNIPPPPERKSKSSRRGRSVLADLPVSTLIGDVKKTPTFNTPYNLYRRPVTNRCCECMPISRDTFVHETCSGTPNMTNVLRLPQLSCGHSAALSLFSNITYTYRHTVRFGYPNITESVLRSHRSQLAVERTVQESLEERELPLDENSKEYKKQKKKCEGRLKKMFNLMKAVMSIPVFKVTGWFLNTVLGFLLTSVQVHNTHLESLKDASLSGKPVIYLPMHKSHLDYVLITYILWHYGIRAPYVAAGDNLNIFGFGRILRSLGGFFIRRRLDKEAGKKDHLYRSVLREYVEELLKRGQSLEFFVEGGRSRSGKALYPKAGLLSIVVDWVLASRNETDGILRLDALIVPVSICYEKIMDGNFSREQMGIPKRPESFWATVKAIWKLFSTTFGNVRVDFCQPFSLKEYLTVNQSTLAFSCVRGDSPVNVPGGGLPSIRDSMHDLPHSVDESEPVLPRSCSDNSIYGIDISVEQEKWVIDALARHVIYCSLSSAPVMSTNIVAFDLLTNHRQGVLLVDLVRSIDKLRDKILNSNKDVGFVGRSEDVIAHACKLLGPTLISLEIQGAEANWRDLYDVELQPLILVLPNLTLPHILELSYYSAPVFSTFQLESLIVCSICAATGITLLDRSSDDNFDSTSFTKESVISYALHLADILKYEYIFSASCQDLETELGNTFESLISLELIVSPGREDTFNEEAQQWTSRIVRSTLYSFQEDDMDDYYAPERQYQLNKLEREQFRGYSSILQPMIESYWVAACQLETLLTNDEPMMDLIKEIHDNLLRRVGQGTTDYPESVAQDMVKNALHSLSDLGVTQSYSIANIRMVSLTDKYDSSEQLHQLITTIDSYKSQ